MRRKTIFTLFVFLMTGSLVSAGSGIWGCSPSVTTETSQVALTITGFGSGSVTSDVGGIACDQDGGTCTGTVAAGTIVTLTAVAGDGYFFNGWRGDCSGIATCAVTADADQNVRASFVSVPFVSNRNLDGTETTLADPFDMNLWTVLGDGTGNATSTTSFPADAAVTLSSRVWSADGSRILFSALLSPEGVVGSNGINLFTISADGTGLVALTPYVSASTQPRSFEWSHDGLKVLYVSKGALDGSDAAGTAYNIWMVDADGSNAVPLTQMTAASLQQGPPDLSPNDAQIVFSSDRALDGSDAVDSSINSNLWIMNADGTGLRTLTQLDTELGAVVLQVAPTWSPRGEQILFLSNRSLDGSNAPNDQDDAAGISNIWTINADGSSPTPLTQFTHQNVGTEASWSPDGTKIVFTSSLDLAGADSSNTSSNIWIMNADGSGLAPLTHYTNVDVFHPVWSTDGTAVFFQGSQDLDPSVDAAGANGAMNIWRVNPDGTNLTPLTRHEAVDLFSGIFDGPVL